MVRYQDVAERETQLLAMTSVTCEEFAALVEPFEAAFQAHMQEWTMTGRRRTGDSSACIPIAHCQQQKIAYSLRSAT